MLTWLVALLGLYGFSGEIHNSDLNKQELCLSKPNCSKIYKSLLVGNENTTWNYQKLAHKYAVYNLIQRNYDKKDDNFTKEEINQITAPLSKED